MSLWRLVLREMHYNFLGSMLGLLSVIAAVCVLVAEVTLLNAHDIQTQKILSAKEKKITEDMRLMEDDYRKIMKELGYNLLILPEGQSVGSFYANGYSSKFMPEDYAKKLANTGIMTINHIYPTLEQKIQWTEQGNRTIILIGTRGEVLFPKGMRGEPMIIAVPREKIILGYELWNNLGLKAGDMITVCGRRFEVSACNPERGSKDDISAWIDLGTAQEIVGKKGMINAILALQCLCPGSDIASLRRDIPRIIPGVTIIEVENNVTVRAKARDRAAATADSALAAERIYRNKLRGERETFASWLIPTVIIGCSVWIGFLTFTNVRDRRFEIGILRALGLRSRDILSVFLTKAAIMGLAGGLLGFFGGSIVGSAFSELTLNVRELLMLFNPTLMILVLLTAPVLSSVASLVPALIASREDPAIILSRE